MPKRRAFLFAALVSVVASLLLASVASAGAGNRRVQILDACDGPTFDATIGAGACLRAGGVTFDKFIGQLIRMGEAPAWRFAPEQLKLDAGGTITAVNRGGELHTFTEVAAFGGGCVPELNQLTPVPECAGAPGIFGATGVPPGTSRTTASLAAGTHRFMCIIHPGRGRPRRPADATATLTGAEAFPRKALGGARDPGRAGSGHQLPPA